MEGGSKIRIKGIPVRHNEYTGRRRVGELPRKPASAQGGGETFPGQNTNLLPMASDGRVTAEMENPEKSEHEDRTRRKGQNSKLRGSDVRPGWRGEGPGGSDARAQGPQGSDEKERLQGPGGSEKNRTPEEATKDQKEVARYRKDHKEVTKKGQPRRPEGAGEKQKCSVASKKRMMGQNKVARDSNARNTLGGRRRA